MKLVSNEDCSESGLCQNPKLASSLVKYLVLDSCARTWSTAGSGCSSWHMLWFKRVKSTQILTFPLAFMTTTIPEVGVVTLAMIPSFSVRLSLFHRVHQGYCDPPWGAKCKWLSSLSQFDLVLSFQFAHPLEQEELLSAKCCE